MRNLTETKKTGLNGDGILRSVVALVGFWAVLAGSAAAADAADEKAPAPAVEISKAGSEKGLRAPSAKISGKVLFDGGDVKVWSWEGRVMAGYNWKPADRVTVSALAGGSYKQIRMGSSADEPSQVSHLGLAEVGASVKVKGTENVDVVLQATAGAVVLGSRETKAAAGVEESKATSGKVASVEAGIEWQLPDERFSLTAGVVYEQADVAYDRGAKDDYGKFGVTLGVVFKF